MTDRKQFRNVYGRCIARTAQSLRPLGYRRRGGVFRKVVGSNSAIMQFQVERLVRIGEMRFTVNLGIVCGQLLQDWEPELAKADVWHGHLQMRVCNLAPDDCGGVAWSPRAHDVWWIIDGRSDCDQLITDVADAVSLLGARFLEPYLSTSNLVSLWRGGQPPGITEHQRKQYLTELEGGGSPIEVKQGVLTRYVDEAPDVPPVDGDDL